MENVVLKPDYSIYPGNYVPLRREEEIREELKHPHEGNMIFPPVNITELTDAFKVEVAMPGVKREDILIDVEGNVLTVWVLHREFGPCPVCFQLHEFNYECFERHIILPENADAEFISAEYKEGILQIYFPKTKRLSKSINKRIVVY